MHTGSKCVTKQAQTDKPYRFTKHQNQNSRTLVFHVALHGTESYALRIDDERKSNAIATWC